MKKADFTKFRQVVREAPLDNTAGVWCMGYLWLNLTVKQADEIADILIARGCPIYKGSKGFEVRTPSGLGIVLSKLKVR